MQSRRILVWIISIIVGIAVAAGTLVLFDTTIEKFALSNVILVFLSSAGFIFIWLDYFFKTQYLSS
ncbi:MAG: hypothetical protein PVF49_05770 [Anaerolineales bacterium]